VRVAVTRRRPPALYPLRVRRELLLNGIFLFLPLYTYKQYIEDENGWIALVRDVWDVCVYVGSRRSQPLVRLLPDTEPEEDSCDSFACNSRFFGARSTQESVQLL
jgi:hypothetical protein